MSKKVKNKLELGKNITEEDLAFNPEQQEKIAKLRKEKENQISLTKKGDNTYRDKLVEGAPCRFTSEGHTFIGYIKNIYKDNNVRYYDIDTPGGLMKKIWHDDVRYREVHSYETKKDFIHKDLYNMTTQKLLNELKISRLEENSDNDYYERDVYPTWMIKAVLETRPHIPTKAERKAIIQNHLSNQRQVRLACKKLKKKKAKK
jgi:hypothetical protein